MSHQTVIDSVLHHTRALIDGAPAEEKTKTLFIAAVAILALAKTITPPRKWEEIEAVIWESVDGVAKVLKESGK